MAGGVLAAVAVVVLACWAGGALVGRLGQPAVVGEIGVGILLGPSFLGWVWPAGQEWLLPDEVTAQLGVLGTLGLVVFMFLVGLELELGLLRGLGRTVVLVSQGSVWVPLGLGGLLALGMYGSFAPEGVGRAEFVLFVAVAMSVTAFPVLARILTEQGLYGTPVGSLAMACAAVVDVVAWCLLAVVVAVAGGGGVGAGLGRAALAGVFLAGMWWGVRPLLARGAAAGWGVRRGTGRPGSGVAALLFGGICLAAYGTDALGVHALFGAFVLGAVMPRGVKAVERAAGRMREFVVPVLLPLFFVGSGLRTDVGLLGGGGGGAWWWAAGVLAVAVVAKWGGATAAALVAGQGARDAVLLGALLNCRGVTELVVLNVGLGLGVIGAELFTMLVLMALVTTAATGPVVRVLRPDGVDGGGCAGRRAVGR
ncbi:cation:proton antiporter [Streptomyces sp. NBC_00249]|uniref:cation:proton antiporter domain-containing protein n=1 Tax=Streptomyces sp. NBC_00249 TaxID=2975690 RepID=UPI0022581D85|nr:cation:proton antiporter [Streptomyces sp. NBC_00249]MCX5199803.1 cation:proton antiporter [Streptomyces sp. NBC_00249]